MTITSSIINFDQEIFDTLWNQCNRLLHKNLGYSVDKFLAESIFKTSDIVTLTKDNDVPVTMSACKIYNGVPSFVFCLFGQDSQGNQDWFNNPDHIALSIQEVRNKSLFVDILVLSDSAMHNGIIKSLSQTHNIKQYNATDTHTRLRFINNGG
jgi:hypothetical protein